MSESPSKAVATPTKGDSSKKELFSAREEQVLKWAWLCLKSGPPDVDIKKLVELAEFKTEKTAQNTWGAIKKKLLSMQGGTENGGNATTPVKRAATDAADEDDAQPTTPAKKVRKTPAKKAKPVKAEDDDHEE